MKIYVNEQKFQEQIKTYLKVFYSNQAIDFSLSKITDNGINIFVDNNNTFIEYVEKAEIIKIVKSNYNEQDSINKIKDLKERTKQQNRQIKRLLYFLCREVTEVKAKWGILTGIRPSKIVVQLMEKENKTKEQIKEILKKKYLVADDKINLLLKISTKEKRVLSSRIKGEINLYIGIPFCPSKCNYCSFTSYPINLYKNQVCMYLEKLIKELEYIAMMTNRGRTIPIRSIYIGGGTPTSIQAKELKLLTDTIRNCFDLSLIKEYTVEAGRPDTITKEKLKILKDNLVSRISVNPQTMNQKTLDIIGRKHTTEQIKSVFQEVKEQGFDVVNMDVILGLPGESIQDVKHTFAEIEKMNPDNLTVHALAIKRGSVLNSQASEVLSEKLAEEMMEVAISSAERMNMEPYYMYRQKNIAGNLENIGYCKAKTECIYNIEIIEETSNILAIGAGGVSKVLNYEGLQRIENFKNLKDYIERHDEIMEKRREFFEKRNSY